MDFFFWVKNQVLREEEFAPVKNANGSNFDTPDSARLLVLRLHSRWVVAGGGFLTHSVPLYATGNFYSCTTFHYQKKNGFALMMMREFCEFQVWRCPHFVHMQEKTWRPSVVEEHSMPPVRLHIKFSKFFKIIDPGG